MSQKTEISIVITTFNQARFISAAIESALDQGAEATEIIVVDDGSTDATAWLAEAYIPHGVKLFVKANGGPSSTLNYGLERAVGNTLVLLSGDDVLLPGSVPTRARILSETDVDIVCSLPHFIGEDGLRLSRDAHRAFFQVLTSRTPLELFSHLVFEGNFICATSVAMTRLCWQRVGKFDEDLWQLQDYDYWLRASAAGLRICFASEPFVAYRLHGNNLSSANPERSERERERVMSTAPELLETGDLQALLFGNSFRDLDLRLSKRHLLPLVLLRNRRPEIRAQGVKQLDILMKNNEDFEILRDVLTQTIHQIPLPFLYDPLEYHLFKI